ncbi:hypothetical protein B7494_g4045 [Chlorociboria aeruginascens]|nr:hypothetical protein B7494_g4045 [Chlorociboria aeruginascens]
MNEARSYMQRGTRFCIRDPDLWVEYAKLEMIYLAKIFMRRKILGLDPDLLSPGTLKGDDLEMAERELEEEEDLGFSTAQDIIRLPDFPATALRANTLKTISVDTEARKDPINTPALNGAIPLAIFDAAKSQPFFCPAAAEQFFDMFSLFIHVPCMPRILSHVVETMKELWKDDAKTANCWIREPWIWTEIMDPEFPMRLGEGLERLKGELGRLKEGNRQMGREREELVKMSRVWIERVLGAEGLDAGIETVLRFTIRKLE